MHCWFLNSAAMLGAGLAAQNLAESNGAGIKAAGFSKEVVCMGGQLLWASSGTQGKLAGTVLVISSDVPDYTVSLTPYFEVI
jgi:hypothetical protein